MTRNLGSTELKRLHRDWRRRTPQRLALVFDGVQNPYNVGSIFRSAAAYGVDQIWLTGHAPSPTDAKVQKTALGSTRYVGWHHAERAIDAIDQLRDDGYRPVAVELAAGAVPLPEVGLAGDTCLVVGHEDRGVTSEALDACDAVGFLPQVGKIGSLNVAAATSIALYEARRQGWEG